MSKHSPHLGEPITFRLNTPHWIRCCGCRLCHLILIEQVNDDEVQIKFYIDEHETEKARKRDKKRTRKRTKKD